MKKTLKIVLSTILVAFLGMNIINSNTVQVSAASEVTIADPVLRAAISKQLGKADGDSITDEDMLRITTLYITSFSEPYLNSLSGLEYATNLKELSITTSYNSTFSDLSQLSGLTKLEKFYMNEGNVSDLTPLQSLPALQLVQMFSNNVSDLTPLKNLSTLKTVNFYDNKIQDISVLANLTGLKELYLGSNEIVNIDALASLTNLTSLSLDDNKITDISVFQQLPQLKELSLMGGSGSSIKSKRPELPEGNLIDDFTPLKYLTNLEYLDLRFNYSKLADISMLEDLTNLIHLNLHHNNFENADVVQNMSKLTYLDMGDTMVHGLPDLSQLTVIETLILSNTPNLTNTDVAKVNPLVTLQRLQIGGSIYDWSTSPLVTDISPLSSLVNLRHLVVSGTGVEDISPLASLTNLQDLGLEDNQISDITPLAGLDKLSSIEANRNHISDFSIFAGNPLANGFIALDQTIELPEGTAKQPTAIVIANKDNTTPAITWITSGTYNNGELIWNNVGNNQLKFAAADGKFSGTVKQSTVQATTSKITVKYVDESGTEIATADDFTGNVGATETISAKAINGYTLKTGQTNPVTMTYTESFQTHEFVYVANPVTSTITVKYVDENGTELAAADVLTGNVGTSETINAKTITNYTLKAGQTSPQTVTYTTAAQTIEFVYEHETSTITVKYVDENGTEIETADVLTGNVGTSANVAAKTINGYTLKAGQTTPQTITYTTAGQTVEFVYTADPVEVPVINDIYEDEDVLSGTATAGLDVEITYPSGTKATVTANGSGEWSLTLTEAISAGEEFQAVTINNSFARRSTASNQTVKAVTYEINAIDVTMTLSQLKTLQDNGTLETYLIDASAAMASKVARTTTAMAVNIDVQPLDAVTEPGVYTVTTYIADPNNAYNGSNALCTKDITVTVTADPTPAPVPGTEDNTNDTTTNTNTNTLPTTGTYELGFMTIGAILLAAGGLVLKRRK